MTKGNFETLKVIGEIEKSKTKKLSVSINRVTDAQRKIDFVSVQELEYNEDKDRYEYSKKGYTITVDRWAGLIKLFDDVSEYLKHPEESEEDTPALPKTPEFMKEKEEEDDL